MKQLERLAAVLAAAMLAAPVVAQDRPPTEPGPPAADAVPAADAAGVHAEGAPDADNTARNRRDRDGASLTPLDQSEKESDREITQQIRQRIVDHEGMSMNGKNVKVITIDGVVTLRGPVASNAERTAITGIAQGTAGVKRVDDQLEVATR